MIDYGMLFPTLIKIDDRTIGRLQFGTYIACYAPAGSHVIETDVNGLYSTNAKFTIAIPADENLYFWWARVQGNILTGGYWHLEQLGHESHGLVWKTKPNNANYNVLIR
jgi:hypothetical protein